MFQVYGNLPFDDTNHKKLIKQAIRGVIFPLKRTVSIKCQHLIKKLLTKASDRIPMRFIKSDPWFMQQTAAEKAAGMTSPELALETVISNTPISAQSKGGLSPNQSKETASSTSSDNAPSGQEKEN